ncbi:cytochrome P450 2J6 [Galendromus occidentalis]|uniref:Cytochrome P450 2J6 n=1 Tax=Galendromus occidentalis TaxID=34638 RepID=A0AAJ6QYM2_9ACAR|nr:cytochrome P450 2J6 [Galendromus occidentalis]
MALNWACSGEYRDTLDGYSMAARGGLSFASTRNSEHHILAFQFSRDAFDVLVERLAAEMGFLFYAACLILLDYLYFKAKYTRSNGPPVWYGLPIVGIAPLFCLPKFLFTPIFNWYLRYMPDVIVTRFFQPYVFVKNSALIDVQSSEYCNSRPALAMGELIGYLTTGRPSWFIFDQNRKHVDWRSVRKTNVMALNVLPKQEKFERIAEVADSLLETIEDLNGRLYDCECDIAIAKLQETRNLHFGGTAGVRITRRIVAEIDKLMLIIPYFFLLISLVPLKVFLSIEYYLPKAWRPSLLKKVYFNFTKRILEEKVGGADEPRDFVEAVLRLKSPDAALDFIRQTTLFNMVASTHTTRHVTMAALSYISLHKRVQEKIQAELDRVVGSAPLTLEHLGELHYMKAAIHEACRMSPPLPTIMRWSSNPVQIGNVTVEANMRIVLFTISETVDPGNFESPQKFIPERYLNDKGIFEPSKNFTIFSRGKRMCPGQDIANMSTQVYCSKILQRFDIVPKSYELEVPGFSGTLIPDSPKIPVRFLLRKGAPARRLSVQASEMPVVSEKAPGGGSIQTASPMSLLFAFIGDLGGKHPRPA